MTNTEKLKILTKNYIGTKDIQKIEGICSSRANQIRKEIEEKYCKGMLLPRYKIPRQFYIKERKINIDELIKFAKIEKGLQ